VRPSTDSEATFDELGEVQVTGRRFVDEIECVLDGQDFDLIHLLGHEQQRGLFELRQLHELHHLLVVVLHFDLRISRGYVVDFGEVAFLVHPLV
jgi:hypothetical protein